MSKICELNRFDAGHTSLSLDNEYSDDTVGEDGVYAVVVPISADTVLLLKTHSPVVAVVAVVSEGMLDGGTEEPSDDEDELRIID